jgi:hypothetical protein
MHTNLVITVPKFGGEGVPEWDESYTVIPALEPGDSPDSGVNPTTREIIDSWEQI